jgi:hypothetical protein
MKKVNWLVVGVSSIVGLLLLFGGGMMERGGMMNNWGYSPSPLSWIGMIFMWLIPVGLVVLAVFGIVWLVRDAGNSKPPFS